MRLLFDVVHPAHVHFYRHLISELETAGHETRVVAREKDVTTRLLHELSIPHAVVGRATRRGRAGLAVELVRRDWALWRVARRWRADAVLTRNPAGVQAARLAGVPGVFDSDDGRAVGIHFRAAAPFASLITTPVSITDDYGAKHLRYPSFKALAFLHPDRFAPDPRIRAELGVGISDPYFVVRCVAFAASHDRHDAGLSAATKREVVHRLQHHGRVFLTSEARLPPDLEHLALPTPPHRMHDVLASAGLCVTDGQSMAGEAAVLGVPSVRFSTTAGRLAVFRELSERYGLVSEYAPGDDEAFLEEVEKHAVNPRQDHWQERRSELLADKCDLTTWMFDLITGLPRRFGRAAS